MIVPSMTQKHFQMIADVIAGMPTHAPTLRAAQKSVAHAFAEKLGCTNARFNTDRFLDACKLPEVES